MNFDFNCTVYKLTYLLTCLLNEIALNFELGFIGVLIRSEGQKVKGQGHSRWRHGFRQQPVKFHLVIHYINFMPFLIYHVITIFYVQNILL